MPAIERKENCTLLPNMDIHNCFGCSPKNSKGMHMEFYINKKKDSVISWYSVPDHLCGWENITHGGIICTMLDEAMGWACLFLLNKFLLSKTINVKFLKPVYIGKKIKIVGKILKVNSEKEAVLQGFIYNDKDETCATASSIVSLYEPEPRIKE